MLSHRVVGVSKVMLLICTCVVAIQAESAVDEAKIHADVISRFARSDSGVEPFFVLFSERTVLAAASRIGDWDARGRYVVDNLQATADRSQNGVRGYLQGRKIEYTSFWIENRIYIPQGTFELARELAKRPEVAGIFPEVTYSISPAQASGATLQSVGWNISQIGADQVWSAYGNRGNGIVVATIDSGAQFTHPALVNQYRGNLGGGSFTHLGSWSDPTKTCTSAPCDDVGHGTHVMGTMVGDDGAGMQIGVAPGAKWIACKACSAAGCPGAALTSCAQWILAPGGDPSKRPHVVNNSWSGPGGDSWYQSYIQNWVAAGIFPAFAIGNTGPNCGSAGSPGDYRTAFASGAADSGDNIASFSSRGPSPFGGVKPDLSAPGVSIYSSYPSNSYTWMNGTSMASPHTAGTVALLWAIWPSYKGNVSGTFSLLQTTAAVRTTTESCGGVAAGSTPNNTYGAGVIQAKAAVDAGKGTANQPPVVTITTPAIDGQQFNCGTPIAFTASASDPEQGVLTSSIQWSGPGTPAGPTGGNVAKTFSCTMEVGAQTITAAVTDAGRATASDAVTVIVINPSLPSAPSNLTASISGGTVQLAWTDNATNETGFKVYRRQQSRKKWGAWTVLQTIASPNATSFTDTVGAGVYQYYVKAYNSAGESAPSGTVQVAK